jgi:hypothetical protein
MFQRYVSIDWSGADREDAGVPLRVVQATVDQPEGQIVSPPGARAKQRSWSRSRCKDWLIDVLRPESAPCMVAMDFGFGLPWGADREVFGCHGWYSMLEAVANTYSTAGTARAAALSINQRFGEHGPYRFNDSRTDFRFYLDRNVAYYRLVETAIPQAISPWYMGSGGTVGFHTVTGLSLLHELICLRAKGQLAFRVWPQEGDAPEPGQHVLVESYPAICPTPAEFGPCADAHERDAWKVLRRMIEASRAGALADAFKVPRKPFGRVEGVSFDEQVRFEGWIFAVS